ncbi:MAG: DUF2341 domain-containing protein [Bacteroidia bacterium]
MKPRLQLKPKNKVRVSAKIRLVYVGAAFAVTVATAFLLYYNFGTSEDSIANEQTGLPGFSKRMPLLISKELVRGNDTLYNFPVLISIKHDELRSASNGGQVINSKGYDIRITKKDGINILSTQVESYNPKNGELNIWVLIDTLANGLGNDLKIYYGNPTVQSELPPMVWMNGYEAVWHFNQDTRAANSRKIACGRSNTIFSEGKFSGALDLSSERKDFISVNYLKNLDITGDLSVSAWIKLRENGRKQMIIDNQGDSQKGYALFIDQSNRLNASFYNGSGKLIQLENENGEKLETDRWYHVGVVFSKNSQSLITYIDGIADRSFITIDIPSSSSAELQIGRNQFEENTYFNGLIDELRIASVSRNQNWLATAFYNETLADQLVLTGEPEQLDLTVDDVAANKQVFLENAERNMQKTSAENQQKSTKQGTSETPVAVSGSREVLQARLNNIRRVAGDNN